MPVVNKNLSPLRTVRVNLLKDPCVEYPELWIKVYVEGTAFEHAQFAEMFARARCTKAKSPEEASLVVFTGGDDVDPLLYGEKAHFTTRFNPRRDERDLSLYKKCLDEGIPMFGVCRGAQFLHVMNGGKLFQDVDGHNGAHTMWDVKKNVLIQGVSSVHHQMCIPNQKGGMEILGEGNTSTRRARNPDVEDKGTWLHDVEAFFYRETCCLGVQGHPEYRGYGGFTKWCLDAIYDNIIVNPDIEWQGQNLRMKADLVAQRPKLVVAAAS